MRLRFAAKRFDSSGDSVQLCRNRYELLAVAGTQAAAAPIEMIKRPDRFLPTLRGGNEGAKLGLLSAICQSRRASERK